jgi:ADP-ribose pyrophosphatase
VTIRDQAKANAVLARHEIFQGRIWDVVSDDVDLGEAGTVTREYVRHPGAVAIIALDDTGRVLLQRQYRHPVRQELWEPPAGILDVPGEPPVEAARRELAEEADLLADDWRTLVTFYSSPGGQSEVIHVFVARQLHPVPPADRFHREAEELTLEPVWLDLDSAADAVMNGSLHSPTTVVGVLAACRARSAPGGLDALAHA